MSSRSLNKVQVIGNLTRDPELRYTPQGTPVSTIGIATNRSWVDSSGQRQEETEFHRVVAWSKLAELCSQLLFKSRKVFVEGRLQTRRWTAQDGTERQTTEVVIDDMIILDSRRRGDNSPDDEYNDDYPSDDGVTDDGYSVGDDVPADDNPMDNSNDPQDDSAQSDDSGNKKNKKEKDDSIKADDLEF